MASAHRSQRLGLEFVLGPQHREMGEKMSNLGKTNIVVMWTVGPGDVAEGDAIFDSHVQWMTGHPRAGDTALLSYTSSKGPELTNPVDRSKLRADR